MFAGFCAVVLAFLCVGAAAPAHAEQLYHIKFEYEVQRDSTKDHWTRIDVADLEVRAGMTGTAFVGDAGVTVVAATVAASWTGASR